MKFRKRPVEIEAVQVRWSTWGELCTFMGDIISLDNTGRTVETYSDSCGETRPFIELTIPTLEGNMIAHHGDWIIKGISNEFYPCRPDIFEKTYEKI